MAKFIDKEIYLLNYESSVTLSWGIHKVFWNNEFPQKPQKSYLQESILMILPWFNLMLIYMLH